LVRLLKLPLHPLHFRGGRSPIGSTSDWLILARRPAGPAWPSPWRHRL